MTRMKPSVKLLLWLALGSAVLASGLAVLLNRDAFLAGFADGMTVAGLLLLMAGLVRVVNTTGFFDTVKFGYIKLVDVIIHKNYKPENSKYRNLADYRARKKRSGNGWPPFAAAALDLAVAAVFICVLVP